MIELMETRGLLVPKKTGVKTRVKTRVKILSCLAGNESLTREELAKHLGISLKGVDWQSHSLRKKASLNA